jgi:hypothetical protein
MPLIETAPNKTFEIGRALHQVSNASGGNKPAKCEPTHNIPSSSMLFGRSALPIIRDREGLSFSINLFYIL